jgi:arylsulfatase A-like enzyme
LYLYNNKSFYFYFFCIIDVGWNDFSYNSNYSLIHTPNIDKLSSTGVRFKNHYVQAVCTPTRASLLTGRYAVNVGLHYVLTPGTPAGLPPHIPTLPQLLRKEGYSALMVGKWHLGHAQWKQTPVGRGFEQHIGNYMWDLDSYSKQEYELPTEPLTVDWVHAYENGSYIHYAEERHATEAITTDAIMLMNEHKQQKNNPLFLYVAYTAAHSPLQPMTHHYAMCSHIPHLWYCNILPFISSI